LFVFRAFRCQHSQIFSEFIKHGDKVVYVIEEASEAIPEFGQLLQNNLRRYEKIPLDLCGYLIKPTQRICQYPILLQQLIKATPEDWTDYPLLGNCNTFSFFFSLLLFLLILRSEHARKDEEHHRSYQRVKAHR
jgi:hypothetical protein